MLQHFDAHPESPRMITFSRTFFLDVIVSGNRTQKKEKKNRDRISSEISGYEDE